jgi:hypothetical protein
MFNVEFRRIAAAAVGALILSTAYIGAAVGPVQAATVEARTA